MLIEGIGMNSNVNDIHDDKWRLVSSGSFTKLSIHPVIYSPRIQYSADIW